MLGSHTLTTSSQLILSLLYGGAAKPDLPPFGEAFFRRFELTSDTATDNMQLHYMERPMAETIFGSPLASALNWWD